MGPKMYFNLFHFIFKSQKATTKPELPIVAQDLSPEMLQKKRPKTAFRRKKRFLMTISALMSIVSLVQIAYVHFGELKKSGTVSIKPSKTRLYLKNDQKIIAVKLTLNSLLRPFKKPPLDVGFAAMIFNFFY